jgi:hypothetical protein
MTTCSRVSKPTLALFGHLAAVAVPNIMLSGSGDIKGDIIPLMTWGICLLQKRFSESDVSKLRTKPGYKIAA